ncbi:PHB depolymerase family esterase [uncultured Fibrobacter sp.]|uniref:T9SS type A sorting domain-containing protein n=1 Tax=uncultured Fibrobacter sp. TaxID=261512 RepID=UPI0025D498EF|nr:PHB depolymerase family esterase [uncultured Fibrobacter sp.]
MRTAILFFFAATISFAQWGGGGGGKSINDYKKISVSGREVYVYAPSNLADNSPLLMSFHGMDQDPNYQQSNTHWEAVADTAGFVVAYPKGATGYSTWDISGDQDTKWITQIIDQLANDYKINKKRVYMSGFSMGGMLSYHAMGKIADKIAAFAPCSGYLMMGAGTAQRPVPIFHTHGTSDNVVGYDGLENNLKSYRNQFKCPSQAEVENNHPNSENKATLYTWGPCDNGIYVKHLKLEGRQHSPSKADVSDIWNFVKGYDLDGPIGASKPESSASAPASSADVAKSSSSGVTGPKSSGVATGSSSSGRGFWGGNRSSSSGHHSGFGSSSSIGGLAVGSSSSIGGVAVGSSSSGIGGQFAAIAQPNDPSLLAVSVYRSSDNGIMVSNAQGKTITVFNSLGHVVRTTRGTAGVQKVYTGAKGVYIVKVGSRTFKTAL